MSTATITVSYKETMNELEKQFTLSNGVQIPWIGLGTWKIEEGEDCVLTIRRAIECGYRHIDTAYAYGNEVICCEV